MQVIIKINEVERRVVNCTAGNEVGLVTQSSNPLIYTILIGDLNRQKPDLQELGYDITVIEEFETAIMEG